MTNWEFWNPELADDYFTEYKKLGGKKTKKQYVKNLNIFFDETWDIFIDGNTVLHETREEALAAVKILAKISYNELDLIFDSVDNITGYT